MRYVAGCVWGLLLGSGRGVYQLRSKQISLAGRNFTNGMRAEIPDNLSPLDDTMHYTVPSLS